MEVLNLPFGVVVYYDYAVALIATAAMALVAFFRKAELPRGY